ncbi:hypothetical protein HBB16_03875 [Pseudonocardia sp. MCCB 268]|nr:hypothetical protein [Pseudonocardia cytotoxica]
MDRLMEIIARLKADGSPSCSVGHRLNEVFALADRVSVSRQPPSLPVRRIEFTPGVGGGAHGRPLGGDRVSRPTSSFRAGTFEVRGPELPRRLRRRSPCRGDPRTGWPRRRGSHGDRPRVVRAGARRTQARFRWTAPP